MSPLEKARAGVRRKGHARHIADPQSARSLDRFVDDCLCSEVVELFVRLRESRTP